MTDPMLVTATLDCNSYLPKSVTNPENPQVDIPRIAKDKNLLEQIDVAARQLPTQHELFRADSRRISLIPDESVHLVVTSPPYRTLKRTGYDNLAPIIWYKNVQFCWQYHI